MAYAMAWRQREDAHVGRVEKIVAAVGVCYAVHGMKAAGGGGAGV